MLKNFLKFKLLFLLITLPILGADPQKIEKQNKGGSELADIDFLISSTEKSIERQKRLRERIIRFQELRAKSMEDEGDVEMLLRLSKNALALLEKIKEDHLIQIFDPAFITELNLLAKPAMKRERS